MREKALKLREERAKLVAQAREVLENEELTAEERIAESDRLMGEADNLKTEIDAVERVLTAEENLAERISLRADRTEVSTDEATANDNAEMETFRSWIRGGMLALTGEQQTEMSRRLLNDPTMVQAAQSVGTDSAGGYTVPEGFVNRLEEALIAEGGMLEVATVISTATGNTLPFPTVNDTANAGAIIAENTEITTQLDVVFAQVLLEAYMYHSKIVRVSLQLLQDSAFDIDGLLARLLAARIARIWNTHFTTGTGTAQPNGIVTASTLGKTAASATAITAAELVDLEHSVDPAYRRPSGRFMFADATLAAIKKLQDAENRFLWLPGFALKEPDTVLGYPYTINQDMPAMTAGLKSVIFGKLDLYMIRRVLGFQLMRLQERYAEFLQVGFIGYARADGELLNAGTNPVKHLIQAAS
jgi:HK97 family phage major capsid protein